MTMFEDFIVKTKTVMGIAGKKANQMFSVTRLSIKLAELKSEMKEQLVRLGKMAYLCEKNGYDKGKYAKKSEKIIAQVDKIREKIKKLRSTIKSTKHKIVCKSCGKEDCDDEAFFCEKCGSELVCDCDSNCKCNDDDDECSCGDECKCDKEDVEIKDD